MVKDSAKYAAGFTDPTLTSGLQFDDLVGAVRLAHSGADVPPASVNSISNADQSTDDPDHSTGNPDHFVGIADFFASDDLADTSGSNADHSAIENSASVF